MLVVTGLGVGVTDNMEMCFLCVFSWVANLLRMEPVLASLEPRRANRARVPGAGLGGALVVGGVSREKLCWS